MNKEKKREREEKKRKKENEIEYDKETPPSNPSYLLHPIPPPP